MWSADFAPRSVASRWRDYPQNAGALLTWVLPAVGRSRWERDCIPLEQEIGHLSKPESKLSLQHDDALLLSRVGVRGVTTLATRLDHGLEHLELTCSRWREEVVLDAPASDKAPLMLPDDRATRVLAEDPGDGNVEGTHDASQGRDGGA